MHVATIADFSRMMWAFVAAARYWQPPSALAPVAPPVVPGADRGQAAPRNLICFVPDPQKSPFSIPPIAVIA